MISLVSRHQASPVSDWYIYLIRCNNGSLYTGISRDPERRLAEHQGGGPRSARYLRGKGPLQLVFQHPAPDRSVASKLEHRLKQLPRASKEKLIAGDLDPLILLGPDASGSAGER